MLKRLDSNTTLMSSGDARRVATAAIIFLNSCKAARSCGFPVSSVSNSTPRHLTVPAFSLLAHDDTSLHIMYGDNLCCPVSRLTRIEGPVHTALVERYQRKRPRLPGYWRRPVPSPAPERSKGLSRHHQSWKSLILCLFPIRHGLFCAHNRMTVGI